MNDFAQNGMKQEHRLQHMSKIKNDLRQIRLRYNSNVLKYQRYNEPFSLVYLFVKRVMPEVHDTIKGKLKIN